MSHDAETAVLINPLLGRRWSPYVYDSQRDVSEDDLQAVFEAARWTMSSFNAQPWRYIVGVRERSRETWEAVLSVLLEGNQRWARFAPVLAIGLTDTIFEHNGKSNRAARHDLGAASACLTVEATARGLNVHQMIGIDPDAVRRTFDIPETVEPLTGLAIGYAAATPLPEQQDFVERDQRRRERKPVDAFILHGGL